MNSIVPSKSITQVTPALTDNLSLSARQTISSKRSSWIKSVFLPLSILINSFVSSISYAENHIYLTRHAEKQSDGTRDPSLTEQGKDRAELLAKQLQDKKITAIYSSDYQRTKQTAKPLAKKLGIEVSIYDPRKLQEFADNLKTRNDNILVVGHSNTTPALAYYLGGDAFGDIDESEYDRLYHLKVSNGLVKSTLLRSQPIKQYKPIEAVKIDNKRFVAAQNTYQMSYRGKPVGKAIHSIKSTNDYYLLHEKTIIESYKIDTDINLTIDKRNLQPSSMRMTGSMGEPVDISLDWKDDRVIGHSVQARAAYKPQGKIKVNAKRDQKTVERSSVLMLAHLFDLESQLSNTFQWYNSYDNSIRTIEASYLGDKTITVPAGTFETKMVQFLGGAPSQIYYISKEAKPKVIQIEVIASPWQYQLLESKPL